MTVGRAAAVVALAGAALSLLLSAPAAATVTTNWAGPHQVDAGTNAVDPSVAMNAQGSGVVAWWEGTQAWAALYADYAWTSPVRINLDHEFAFQVRAPVADIDDAGRAVVCWLLDYDDSTNATQWGESYAAVYDPATGWSNEHLLGPGDVLTGDTPSCAIGVGGRAFVTFLDSSDANTTYEKIGVYTPGAGWANSNLASNASGDLPAYAQVEANGELAAVAWMLLNGSLSVPAVVATTYTLADGWTTPYSMDGGGGGTGLFDIDVAGTTAYFLVLGDGEVTDHTMMLYSATRDGNWTGPLTVGGPGPVVSRGMVAADASGDVTVTWTSQPNGTTRDYYGRYYGWQTGWDNVTRLENVAGKVQARGLAPDRNGGALTTFVVEEAGFNQTYWARYVPGMGWRAAQPLYGTMYNLGGMRLASSPDQALLVWYEFQGAGHHVIAYALDRDDTPPVVTVTSPPGAFVNNSTVAFEGYGATQERFYFEGQRLPLSPSGEFRFELTLADGDYAYLFSALDDEDNYQEVLVEFTVDTVGHLEILFPLPGSQTDALVGGIQGLGEPNGSATVGGVAVPVEANGSFSHVVLLFSGVNTFDVVAVDPAGNVVRTVVTITRVPSGGGGNDAQVAQLAANLSAAVAELANASAQVAALQADANASSVQVAAAQLRLSTAEANVTVLQAQLSAANAEAATATARAQKAEDSAGGAFLLALLGMALGVGGLAVGSVALLQARKKSDAEPRGQAPFDGGRQK